MLSSNFNSLLRNANLQITPARLSVLHWLEAKKEPIDAQFLIDNLTADRVTVFRILNTFVEKGIVRKLEFMEGKSRYELNTSEHHHLYCKSCGNIEDISDCNISALEKDIQKKKGFLVSSHSLEFFGICKNCQR